jgi:hypothetical protein
MSDRRPDPGFKSRNFYFLGAPTPSTGCYNATSTLERLTSFSVWNSKVNVVRLPEVKIDHPNFKIKYLYLPPIAKPVC